MSRHHHRGPWDGGRRWHRGDDSRESPPMARSAPRPATLRFAVGFAERAGSITVVFPWRSGRTAGSPTSPWPRRSACRSQPHAGLAPSNGQGGRLPAQRATNSEAPISAAAGHPAHRPAPQRAIAVQYARQPVGPRSHAARSRPQASVAISSCRVTAFEPRSGPAGHQRANNPHTRTVWAQPRFGLTPTNPSPQAKAPC